MAKASAGSVAGLSDVAAVDRATRLALRVAETCRVSAAAMHRTVDRVKEEVVKKSRIYTIDEILGRNTSVGQFRLVFFHTTLPSVESYANVEPQLISMWPSFFLFFLVWL